MYQGFAMSMKPRILTVGQVARPISEWVELHGVPASTIRARITLGWPIDQTVTVTVDRRFRPQMKANAGGPQPCPQLWKEKGTGQAFCKWMTSGERYSATSPGGLW
eukprot:Opistho-1_new@39438